MLKHGKLISIELLLYVKLFIKLFSHITSTTFDKRTLNIISLCLLQLQEKQGSEDMRKVPHIADHSFNHQPKFLNTQGPLRTYALRFYFHPSSSVCFSHIWKLPMKPLAMCRDPLSAEEKPGETWIDSEAPLASSHLLSSSSVMNHEITFNMVQPRALLTVTLLRCGHCPKSCQLLKPFPRTWKTLG